MVGLALALNHPAAIWWGPDLWLIHNEAYAHELLRERAPGLGKCFDAIWGDVAALVRPKFDEVLKTGRGQSWVDESIDIEREGVITETFWTYSFVPILGADGSVLGIFNSARETTARVLQDRHDALLLTLEAELLAADTSDAMIDRALATIGSHLGARRTGFSEIDISAGTFEIRRCWTGGAEMPDITGRYPLGTFGRISDELASGKAIIIEDNETDVRTADPATLAAYSAIELRSGVVVPILERGTYVGGIFAQDDVPRRWTPHQAQLAQAAADRLWQALKRARAEVALRESEQRYRLIFEQADDIIFTADIDQRITAFNAAGAAAMGVPAGSLIGCSIADFVSPDDFRQTSAMLATKLRDGGNTRHEVTVLGADGRRMRWDNNSTLVIDRDGKPVGLLSISRDVTERRAFDERQSLLIHELNHRVKNTLALVQGIAHQSFRSGVDPTASQSEFLARLRTLAAAHDLLTREQWEGVTLAELVRAATAPLDAARIMAVGTAVTVTPKAAVALAMALYELGTNAVKYGALSVPTGSVDINWGVESDRLHVGWRERGGPPVVTPLRSGFGVKMIERALASDLGGTVTMDFAVDGARCTIDAPCKGNVL